MRLLDVPPGDRKFLAVTDDDDPSPDLMPGVPLWQHSVQAGLANYNYMRSGGSTPQEAIVRTLGGLAVVGGAVTVGYGAKRGYAEFQRWRWQRS